MTILKFLRLQNAPGIRPSLLGGMWLKILVSLAFLFVAPRYGHSQQTSSAAPPEPAENEEVQRALRLLQTGIVQTGEQLRDLDQRLPKAEGTLERLIETANSIQVGKRPPPPPPEKPETKKVKYRPPLERLTQKKKVTFICENDRVSFVDFDAINKNFKNFENNKSQHIEFDLPDCDFLIEGKIDGENVELTVIRKPNHPGESLAEIQNPQSRFQKLVLAQQPGEYYVDFSVWPDSYAAFRETRSIAWAHGFDVGWSPMSSGEKMKLRRGPSIGAIN